MENKRDLQAFVEKVILGLQRTREKLIASKIKEGKPLVISRDGRIVFLDPRTMQEIKPAD